MNQPKKLIPPIDPKLDAALEALSGAQTLLRSYAENEPDGVPSSFCIAVADDLSEITLKISGELRDNRADSWLRAAAPDLGKALSDLLEYALDVSSELDERPPCLLAAREALEKARLR